MAFLTPDEITQLKLVREMGRKSLFFLATRLLGYHDVDMNIHGPIIRPLDALVANCTGTDIVTASGECMYIPDDETLSTAIPMDVPRRFMLQAFRGSLKTTLNTQAHLIQLLLNFPHMSALIYHNTEDKAKLIMGEIVDHFQKSPRMLEVYPEYAIPTATARRRAMSNNGFSFTSPARKSETSLYPDKKEPTFTAVGLGTSQAGQHVSVIKMSDVVEETNSGTAQMRNKVYKNIQMAFNLLEDPLCVVFVEGTPYDPDDAYGRIVQKQWFGKDPSERTWSFTFMPAYEIDTKGKPRLYTPDEMSLPWLKAKKDIVWSKWVTTKKGQYIPVWPTWRGGRPKFTNETLEEKRIDDPYIFGCQQLLRPASEDATIFPPSKCFHRFPANQLYKLDEQLRVMAVDTAETLDENYSNDTAMAVATISDTLLRVITHGIVGMMESDEILDVLFDMYEEAKPNVIFVEETSFVRGLKGQIQEREQRKGYTLPIEYLNRKANKKMRIRAALRSPLLTQRMKFSSNLSDMFVERVLMEMSGFPRAKQDDVLDVLADISVAAVDLEGYNNPRIRETLEKKRLQDAMKIDFQEWADKMLGFGPIDNDPESRPYGF